MDKPLSVVALDDGRQAAYEVIGRGEPMLYFTGGPGENVALLRDDAQRLANRFAVHLIEPHGSGASSAPADPSQYDALSEREMEQGLSRHRHASWYPAARAVWDTWSHRILAATDNSELDRMMVSVLPLYMAHPERPEAQARIDAWRRDLRSNLAAARAWEGGLWETLDLRPLLARIACPTLLLVGELDMICGPTHGQLIAERVRGSEIIVVPDCGHFIPTEAPDAFDAAVISFCELPVRERRDRQR
jgi:pimeloyl-ACP methyl ester carboxylesterase